MPRTRPPKVRWRTLLALVVPALLTLVATVVLGIMVTRSTLALSDNVRLTQNLVDGNVRTLSQAQRELLRLQTTVMSPTTSSDQLELRRALAAQRIQESGLDYQVHTLGNAGLLSRARALAAEWTDRVEPLVRAVQAVPPASPTSPTGGIRARTAAADAIRGLELGYNQLVSDAEITRKVQASTANAATEHLVSSTRSLLVVLGISTLSFVALVAGTVQVLLLARRQQVVAAERLKEARAELQRHSLAVQTTDNPVVISDAQGRVEWVNDAFVRRTGYALGEVVGQVPGHLLQGPDSDPATVALMRESIAEHRQFTCEVLNYTKDRVPYWIALDVRPIVGDDGIVTGFVSVQTDVTQRRLTEEALVTAKEVAEETARAKAQFLASMSHEIRTPLNAVLGLTELLLDTELADEQRDYVTTAHQSGRHLLALVNDILDFSALDADTVEVETVPADIRGVLDDVSTMLAPMAARSGVGLTCTVDPEVPRLLCTDATRLRQVLINLVGNGLKFTEVGGVVVSAGYASCPDDDSAGRLTLTVRDTGIGISPDRQARIFDPFVQGDASTTRTHGGTGLGLAISTRIADRLGGTLTLESAEGEGSTFTFAIPVRACLDDGGDVDPVSVAPPVTDIAALRVLLVEDDSVNRMVAMSMLGRLGVVADVAEDGQVALEASAATAYDVILMDVHMPRLDGVAATTAIRARGGRQPRIVALTANALEGDRDRMLAAGMDDYVSKPFRLEDLRAALSHVPTPV